MGDLQTRGHSWWSTAANIRVERKKGLGALEARVHWSLLRVEAAGGTPVHPAQVSGTFAMSLASSGL